MNTLKALKRNFFPVYKHLAQWYLWSLEHIVLRLFGRPDLAVRLAFNRMQASPAQVIANYLQGVHVMGNNYKNELSWRSTTERAVITPSTAHVGRRLRQYMNQKRYEIRCNENFDAVIRACRREERTWINESVIDIYTELHVLGWGQSLEAYDEEGRLAGGLWGLKIGRTFSIMSMFHRTSHAGSIVLGTLIDRLKDGELDMIDCHLMNSNFKRYGARTMPPEIFTEKVVQGLKPHSPAGTNGREGTNRPAGTNGRSRVSAPKKKNVPAKAD